MLADIPGASVLIAILSILNKLWASQRNPERADVTRLIFLAIA